VVDAILRAAGPELVLVGGQALAFWLDVYSLSHGVEELGGAITRDIDFLAESPADQASVKRLAQSFDGEAAFPRKSAITALVGQAIRKVESGAVWNVDVLFRVIGLDTEAVFAESADSDLGNGVVFRVMNPLHLLKSRMDNLYSLREKQDSLGVAQLRCAIQIVQRMQVSLAELPDQSAVRRTVRDVARWALRTDAGKKVAKRFGVHVADAIEPAAVAMPAFFSSHLPRLLPVMSSQRRAELMGYVDHLVPALKEPRIGTPPPA
jgi:hypothetical protein